MAFSIALTNEQWTLVADLFDPPRRRGAPSKTDRSKMVDAMHFLARTGCKWRYLPERFGPWGAVWQQWRRWRDNGVWAKAMTCLARHIRVKEGRDPMPSMVVIDAQTWRGGRAGRTFHQAGGWGWPDQRGQAQHPRRSHRAADRCSSGLREAARCRRRPAAAPRRPAGPAPCLASARALDKAAQRHNARFEVRSRPPGTVGCKPLALVWRVETTFAQLGRWRPPSRCFEGSVESARAWLEVACFGYMLGRA